MKDNEPGRWEDITQLCQTAASELSVGGLVHSPSFTLLDAMSALELLDPKMDKDPPPRTPIQRLLDDGDLSIAPSLPCLAAALGRLQTCEVAWLEGGALPESLFTCLLLHPECTALLAQAVGRDMKSHTTTEPELATLVLAANIFGTLRSCNIASDVILLADIYEEEDFYSTTYGFVLKPLMGDRDILELLNLALDALSAAAAAAPCTASPQVLDSLKAHTTYRLKYLQACQALKKAFSNESSANQRAINERIMNGEQDSDPSNMQVDTPVEGVRRAQGLFQESRYAMEALLLTATPALSEKDEKALAVAFQPEYNRSVLGSTPHRLVPYHTVPEAQEWILLTAKDLMGACGVVESEGMQEARRYLERWSSPSLSDAVGHLGRWTGPNIFPRSAAFVCLYRGELMLGRFGVEEFVAGGMITAGVPPSVVQHCPEGLEFAGRSTKPLYEILRALCLNLSRKRSKIDLCLADWAAEEEDAAALDESFRDVHGLPAITPRFASNWVLTEVLYLMQQYLRIGLRLELHNVGELPAIYFYLNFVVTRQIAVMTLVEQSKEQLAAARTSEENGAGTDAVAPKRVKKRGGKKKSQQRESGATTRSADTVEEQEMADQLQVQSDMICLRIWQALAQGLFYLLCGLRRMVALHEPDCHPSPAAPDDGQQVCGASAGCGVPIGRVAYSHRFAPFGLVPVPSPVSFDEFREALDFSDLTPHALLQHASACFRAAKAGTDQLRQIAKGDLSDNRCPLPDMPPEEEIVALARVAVANTVCIARVASDTSVVKRIDVKFSSHAEFPIVAVDL